MFTKKILAAAITSQPSANGVADAIDFDGTNDYLSRSSDLVGNANGKTFTFSAWVWINNDAVISAIYSSCVSSVGSERFSVVYSGSGGWTFTARNSANTAVYNKSLSNVWPRLGWNHLLLSVDLTNSTNHFVFVNDVQQAGGFITYTNDFIDFTNAYHSVGAGTSAVNKCNGRISNVFLDYTYRDLSIEANRRLFITADRKPTPKATLQGLNPILYLPLNDPTQPGKNLGTGGDFALNGVVARSGRGPNQFNAPYSDLNGSTQYLSRATALAGIADGKAFTLSFVGNYDTTAGGRVITISSTTNEKFYAWMVGTYNLQVVGLNSAGTVIFLANIAPAYGNVSINRNYCFVISIDLTTSTNRGCFVNGQPANVSWDIYVNDSIDFAITSESRCYIGADAAPSSFYNGRLGNVFFDTKYIDLSQPANLAKFVTGTGIDAKPADLGANGEKPFGTPPLIYLPMYGNNAGKNYGTGGDFTVNSGPFTGARGPNEYWGNKADFVQGGVVSRLYRSVSLLGITDTKTVSASFTFIPDTVGSTTQIPFFFGDNGTNQPSFWFGAGVSGRFIITARNSGSTILSAETGTGLAVSGGQYSVLLCIDMANGANRKVFVNGSDITSSFTWYSYFNTNFIHSDSRVNIGARLNDGVPGGAFDGKLSEFYFTTDYIDFSQEANRLKFRDAFGNPVDLRPQIAAGTLPNPAIYMRFDPANFGKNDGTGGDFVVNGTITDGGQL